MHFSRRTCNRTVAIGYAAQGTAEELVSPKGDIAEQQHEQRALRLVGRAGSGRASTRVNSTSIPPNTAENAALRRAAHRWLHSTRALSGHRYRWLPHAWSIACCWHCDMRRRQVRQPASSRHHGRGVHRFSGTDQSGGRVLLDTNPPISNAPSRRV